MAHHPINNYSPSIATPPTSMHDAYVLMSSRDFTKFLTAVVSMDETKRVKTFSILKATTWTEDKCIDASCCTIGKAAQHGLYHLQSEHPSYIANSNLITYSTPPMWRFSFALHDAESVV